MTDQEYHKLKQIEESLQAFDRANLYDSSIALWRALDYQSNKTTRLSPATFEGFLEGFGIGAHVINKDKALAKDMKQLEFI